MLYLLESGFITENDLGNLRYLWERGGFVCVIICPCRDNTECWDWMYTGVCVYKFLWEFSLKRQFTFQLAFMCFQRTFPITVCHSDTTVYIFFSFLSWRLRAGFEWIDSTFRRIFRTRHQKSTSKISQRHEFRFLWFLISPSPMLLHRCSIWMLVKDPEGYWEHSNLSFVNHLRYKPKAVAQTGVCYHHFLNWCSFTPRRLPVAVLASQVSMAAILAPLCFWVPGKFRFELLFR